MSPLDRLERAAKAAATRGARFVSRHPRALSGTVLVALAGFGVTAFGIAPMAPDAADLPRRVISESVVLPDLAAQTEALAVQEMSLYRSETTRGSDTADALLRRLNVADAAAAAFLRADPNARQLFEGRPGKRIQLRTDDFGRVQELVARYPLDDGRKFPTQFVRLRIERAADGLRSQVETAPLVPQARLGSGTLRTTFFAASDDARLPDAVASQLTEMFSAEIDFHRGLKRGDSFTVLYEALTADGEPVAGGDGEEITGRVLAAEIVSRGRSHSAVWFEGARAAGDPAGPTRGGYFGLDGQGKRHAFLASPLEFSRITSGFEIACTRSCRPGASIAASTTARPPAPRCAASATAWSSSPAGRTATATWSRSGTATTARRSTLTSTRSTWPRVSASSAAPPSAPSAPPAGPPARTCTSSSASRTRSRIRWRWRRPPRRC